MCTHGLHCQEAAFHLRIIVTLILEREENKYTHDYLTFNPSNRAQIVTEDLFFLGNDSHSGQQFNLALFMSQTMIIKIYSRVTPRLFETPLFRK